LIVEEKAAAAIALGVTTLIFVADLKLRRLGFSRQAAQVLIVMMALVFFGLFYL
jgi:hypothetical protein